MTSRGAASVTPPTVGEVVEVLEKAYPPRLAEEWDTGIGLTCGDRRETVRTVLLAVDVDATTVGQAVDLAAEMLVTHHPLLFRAVQSVAADTAKGALLHRLIRGGIAHFAAHTNADKARGGVNDALADVLGLTDVRPLVPDAPEPMDKVVVFVPAAGSGAMIHALASAGAGRLGNYGEAAFSAPGTGQFRPLAGAHPTIGTVGEVAQVEETRIEMILPRRSRSAVAAALRAAHPYEEPAFDFLELASPDPAPTGSGRLGSRAEATDLAGFVAEVAAALPETAGGVRAAGDLSRPVRTVALCGGAGGSYLSDAARVGADVYVTSDLSHHVVAEFVALPGHPAIIDVAHWAGEWPFLSRAAGTLQTAFGSRLTTVVSTVRTDPWVLRGGQPSGG